jgi:hypothetical protein
MLFTKSKLTLVMDIFFRETPVPLLQNVIDSSNITMRPDAFCNDAIYIPISDSHDLQIFNHLGAFKCVSKQPVYMHIFYALTMKICIKLIKSP